MPFDSSKLSSKSKLLFAELLSCSEDWLSLSSSDIESIECLDCRDFADWEDALGLEDFYDCTGFFACVLAFDCVAGFDFAPFFVYDFALD